MSPDTLLTVNEAVRLIGCSPWTLRSAMRKGYVLTVPSPGRKNGVLIPESALRAYPTRMRPQPPSASQSFQEAS